MTKAAVEDICHEAQVGTEFKKRGMKLQSQDQIIVPEEKGREEGELGNLVYRDGCCGQLEGQVFHQAGADMQCGNGNPLLTMRGNGQHVYLGCMKKVRKVRRRDGKKTNPPTTAAPMGLTGGKEGVRREFVEVEREEEEIYSVVFYCNTLYVGYGNGDVSAFCGKDGSLLYRYNNLHGDVVSRMLLMPVAPRLLLVSGSWDQSICVTEIITPRNVSFKENSGEGEEESGFRVLHRIEKAHQKGYINDLAVTSYVNTGVCSCSSDGTIKVWNFSNGHQKLIKPSLTIDINSSEIITRFKQLTGRNTSTNANSSSCSSSVECVSVHQGSIFAGCSGGGEDALLHGCVLVFSLKSHGQLTKVYRMPQFRLIKMDLKGHGYSVSSQSKQQHQLSERRSKMQEKDNDEDCVLVGIESGPLTCISITCVGTQIPQADGGGVLFISCGAKIAMLSLSSGKCLHLLEGHSKGTARIEALTLINGELYSASANGEVMKWSSRKEPKKRKVFDLSVIGTKIGDSVTENATDNGSGNSSESSEDRRKTGAVRGTQLMDLPFEVLCYIFTLLPFTDAIKYGCVCRRFYELSLNQNLWRQVDLSGVSDSLTDKDVDFGMQIVQRRVGGECINYIDLSYCEGLTDASLSTVCSTCPRIHTLSVNGCHKLTDKGMENLVQLGESLTCLNISGCWSITDGIIYLVTKACTSLEELYLSECFDLTNMTLSYIVEGNLPLRVLHMRANNNITCDGLNQFNINNNVRYEEEEQVEEEEASSTDDSAEGDEATTVSKLRRIRTPIYLEELDLSECRHVNDDCLISVAEAFTYSLLRLNIGRCSNVTDAGVRVLCGLCNQLTHLDLGSCYIITDISLHYIVVGCENMQSLVLAYCTNISDEGVMALEKSLDSLKLLDLTNCAGLTRSAYMLFKNKSGSKEELCNAFSNEESAVKLIF
eukprot:Nk52_evm1s331 gene=Nk52_evmTU1s331